MNIKALLTSAAIIGSSSTAMARPATFSAQASWSVGVSTQQPQQPVVRDHRTWQWQPAPFYVRQDRPYDWNFGGRQPQRTKLLADGLQFAPTDSRKDVIVGMQAGAFNTIELDAQGGRTYVQKVGIEFSNGAVQIINVNRTLFGNGSMTFDLDGNNRTISRIFIYRADNEEAVHMNIPHHGEFAVFAT